MTSHRDQTENLDRVSARIGALILDWCADRLFAGPHEFHLHDLEAHVRARVGGAPDSTSRILRLLRSRKQLDYVVVRRSESLYRLVRVGTLEAA